jgi:hypothetical protein
MLNNDVAIQMEQSTRAVWVSTHVTALMPKNQIFGRFSTKCPISAQKHARERNYSHISGHCARIFNSCVRLKGNLRYVDADQVGVQRYVRTETCAREQRRK